MIAGRYRLIKPLGSGGNGIVWLATDQQLGREVAVKRAFSADGEEGVRRAKELQREARILASLNHPNVVTIFDVPQEGAEWFIVMEYVEQGSLAERDTLPPGRVARFGAQIADALEVVHAKGVLHRDLKPGNVLLAGRDRAKLSDFGISRVVWSEETLSDGERTPLGTPGFAAPEVVRGDEDHSPAADVFSLGATLFRAVEGTTPYGEAANPQVLLRRTEAGAFVTARRAGPLGPVLSALLQDDPAKRPTVAEARRMLERVAEPGGPEPPTGRWRHRAEPGGRKRAVAVAGGAVAILVAVGLVIVNWPSRGTPRPVAKPSPKPIGVPRTADPCALTDPAVLTRFGDTELTTDNGNFDRCDVIVTKGRSDVDVEVEFDVPAAEDPPGQVQRVGAVGVIRAPRDGGECDRTLLLPDGRVYVTATQDGEGSVDVCTMADAATTRAVAVASRGPIPRRQGSPNPASLIGVDACALLDAPALSRFPGVDALHPERGFGGWECTWNSTTDPLKLQLIFDHNEPLTAADGRPVRLGGHQAFVQPNGYGDKDCEVQVVHRRYVDATGQPTEELLLVVVTGDEPVQRRCSLATTLAGSAASRLPHV